MSLDKKTPLREWREAHRLTVREVAALSGVSASEISRAERGLIRLGAMKKVRLARALGASLEELFEPVEALDG